MSLSPLLTCHVSPVESQEATRRERIDTGLTLDWHENLRSFMSMSPIVRQIARLRCACHSRTRATRGTRLTACFDSLCVSHYQAISVCSLLSCLEAMVSCIEPWCEVGAGLTCDEC